MDAYLTNKAPSRISSRRLVLTLAAALFQGLLALSAHSQAITFSVGSTDVTTAAGTSVVFSGTVTNVSGVTLNASDFFFNFSGYDPRFLDATQLLGTPDFTVPDHTFSFTVPLFSVALAATALPATAFSIDVSLSDVNGDIGNDTSLTVMSSGSTHTAPELDPKSSVAAITALICGLAVLAGHRKRQVSR